MAGNSPRGGGFSGAGDDFDVMTFPPRVGSRSVRGYGSTAARDCMSSYIVFVNNRSTISQLYNQEKWLNERVFYTYEEIRGFAARFTNEEVDYISHAIGVLAVIKDEATSNFAENVVIGLVDSGIWPEAESFNDAGLGPVPIYWNGYCESGDSFNSSFCNRKLIGARYFTKGFNFLKADKPTDHFGRDYDSPRDGSGHGTHTASTAAGALVDHANLFGFAEGTAKGIAYNARIAMYKACAFHWCPDSDILAAMESAIQDGVQILSLSIGGPETPYYASSIARGGFAAIKKGIFVTCAAGNNGPISGSVMNTAPWLTTVGAGSIDRSFPVDVMLGNGLIFTGCSLYPSNLTRTDAFPLVYDGFCRHLLKRSYNFKGKIVVCPPGGD
ncbi:subtilisin-like protease SBT1.7 [Camellia sinensis]|uniref:subtilisin-like protease SBT1.7 n=1 Tax=Camellia sinensis TaxID=4442 RepID=UPI00103556C8|nr:subtilisin-like protease SBT1.7 [Camellia sinensis]